MTNADTTAAFLAKIIAHPADDGPRLVMADWCEEHGQGERAEYIRIGCELAGIQCNSCKGHGSYSLRAAGGYGMRNIPCDDCKAKLLRRRAHELLTQHEPDWTGEFMPDAKWTYAVSDRSFTFRDGGQAIFHWHRGFISQVECRLETWRGRTCERCEGNGKRMGLGDEPPRAKCHVCHGVGRTGGIGRQLVRRAPVEAVVVDGKDSRGGVGLGLFWWEEEHDPLTGHDIPVDLFDKLEGFTTANCRPCNDPRRRPARQKFYPSADAANAALSAALLAESRAALEPSGPRVVQCGT